MKKCRFRQRATSGWPCRQSLASDDKRRKDVWAWVIKSQLDSVLITEAAQVTAGTCGNAEISERHYSRLLPPSTWKQDVSCYTTRECNLCGLLELSKVPAARGKCAGNNLSFKTYTRWEWFRILLNKYISVCLLFIWCSIQFCFPPAADGYTTAETNAKAVRRRRTTVRVTCFSSPVQLQLVNPAKWIMWI